MNIDKIELLYYAFQEIIGLRDRVLDKERGYGHVLHSDQSNG